MLIERVEKAAASEKAARVRAEQARKVAEKQERSRRPRKSNRQGVGEAFLKSTMHSIGTKLVRGILGSLLK